MSKKIVPVLVGIFLFLGYKNVYAGVIINEVRLYPTESRFVELYNQDNSEVDLTNWYIQRKTQSGSSFNSLVSSTFFENKKINANGYFLISRSSVANADIVLSTLTLTESNVIQIKNSNGEIIDKICWGDVTDCGDSKIPNPTENQSVQRDQNNLLIVGTPTIGVQNYTLPVVVPQAGGSSTTSSTQTVQTVVETKPKIIEIPKIKTKIIAKQISFVGIPVEFDASTTGYSNEPLHYGKYFWSFGDGDSKEIKANEAKKFSHTFFYEGEYEVILEYYSNCYSENPDASNRIIIQIMPANISISRVGDEKDFFIEISNDTEYDADLFKWALMSGEKSFSFPKNMILPSKKKIILSPKITGFSTLDKDTLKLVNSQSETIFDYSSVNNSVSILTKKNSSIKTIKESIPVAQTYESTNSDGIKIPVENLSAEAVKSEVDTGTNLIYGIGLFSFLGIGASAAYFLRKYNRKIVSKTDGSDFEILDE